MNKRIIPSTNAPQYELFNDTLKRIVVHESIQMDVLTDVDSNFWIALKAGLTALNNWNMWIATIQMQKIVSETLLQLATEYINQQGNVQLLQYYIDEWQCQPNQQSILHAYQNAVRNYRIFSDTLRIAPLQTSEHEEKALALLDVIERQVPLSQNDVIFWSTISLVLPAYNEEEVIAETIYNCLRAVSHFCPNAEIIVVDDGSRDTTGLIVDKIALNDARVAVVHNRPNKGYGGALLAGFAAARGEWLFFMDSDGQFDIRDIAKLLNLTQQQDAAAILGYRAKRNDPIMRKINAWGWKKAARFMLGLKGIRDIDCAFKLFPTSIMRKCGMTSQGAAVNAEFLAKFQRMNTPIFQIAVQHYPRTKGSPTGANLHVIVQALKDLFILRKNLKTWRPTQNY